ncbi:MAG: hypothetical protein NMK33_05690 [Candidatus Cardinium sp.]|uniref:hypothetical protein n=1 Tax=Cardinium endosymbiont of Dermatophagoides farinae TaxID=2597823 RepID=UPI0011825735|nr:hypothetical protein [Cardinium endosymbiont of Dermatophagoides farinae]TSJ80898.1 hypothetical protein FPG78_02485 [Cardinium endosymbiont of Dermatophagoides farinae]UWW96910.1 MAG: hypothetical protein NMK33_05690 [Candidatus Cardinium sp.]
MKNNKGSTKLSNVFVQGITALPLALSLQFSAGCTIKQQNMWGESCKMSYLPLCEDTPTLKDIFGNGNLVQTVRELLPILNDSNSEDIKQILNQYYYYKDKLTILAILLQKAVSHELFAHKKSNKFFDLIEEMIKYSKYIDFNKAKEGISSFHYILDLIQKDLLATKKIQKILLKLLEKYEAIDFTSQDKNGRPPIKVLLNLSRKSFSNADPGDFSSIISKTICKYKLEHFLLKDRKDRCLLHYVTRCPIPFLIPFPVPIEDKIKDKIEHNLNLCKNLIKLLQGLGCSNQEIFDMFFFKDKKERNPLRNMADCFSDIFEQFVEGLVDLLHLDSGQLKRIKRTLLEAKSESKKKSLLFEKPLRSRYRKCINIVEEKIQKEESKQTVLNNL